MAKEITIRLFFILSLLGNVSIYPGFLLDWYSVVSVGIGFAETERRYKFFLTPVAIGSHFTDALVRVSRLPHFLQANQGGSFVQKKR